MIGFGTSTRPQHAVRVIIVGHALIAACLVTPPASAKPAKPQPLGSAPGSQVTIFNPDMPVGEIQATLDAVYASRSTTGWAVTGMRFLFLPGTYGTAATPLQVKVG